MANVSDDRHPQTGYLIWNLSTKWRAAVDRALSPLGLTHGQYVVLATLFGVSRNGQRPSQRELADVGGLEPMHVSKLARSLERAGLLARDANPDDPRAYRLALTARGDAVLAQAVVSVRALHEQLLAPLGEPGDPRRTELERSLHALLRHARTLDVPDPGPTTPLPEE